MLLIRFPSHKTKVTDRLYITFHFYVKESIVAILSDHTCRVWRNSLHLCIFYIVYYHLCSLVSLDRIMESCRSEGECRHMMIKCPIIHISFTNYGSCMHVACDDCESWRYSYRHDCSCRDISGNSISGSHTMYCSCCFIRHSAAKSIILRRRVIIIRTDIFSDLSCLSSTQSLISPPSYVMCEKSFLIGSKCRHIECITCSIDDKIRWIVNCCRDSKSCSCDTSCIQET